jgi:Transcriptional regulator
MQKHTSRQLQAQKTKRKIYNAAVDLFDKHGFDNTTIEDISRKAGVSVGAFYHYYPSKSDVYQELYKKIDEYYETIVEAELIEEDFFDNIIIFFRYYGAYNSKRGLDAVKQLFNTQSAYFLYQNRYMYKLLIAILEKGKEGGHFSEKMSVADAEDFLRIISRGVIYDWLLHEGKYDLETKMVESITLLRCVFVR